MAETDSAINDDDTFVLEPALLSQCARVCDPALAVDNPVPREPGVAR